jgi:hypothetical protein
MTARHRSLLAFAFAAGLLVASASARTLGLPPELVSLASDQGVAMLSQSQARRAYAPMSMQFVTQKNQAFCGVASLVMVLNALDVPAPPTPDIEPFTTFTQDNVLGDRTEPVLKREVLMQQGMTLDQFADLLRSYAVAAEVRHANDSSVDGFRTAASRQLAAPDRYVVVNYLRSAIGQERGGHLSPLGAYDAASDRFLILDVSRYKYPPVWVKTADLFAAMDTVDRDNAGRRRGFVLIGGEPPR